MNKRGFTLIELLISIAILGVMAAVVAPNIGKAKKDQQLYQASQEIKAKLLEVQGLALAPPDDNNKANVYGVVFTSRNPVKYQVKRKIDGADEVYPAGTSELTLTDIKLASPASLPVIWYTVGSGQISGFSGSKIELVLTNDRENKRVILNKATGAVNVTN